MAGKSGILVLIAIALVVLVVGLTQGWFTKTDPAEKPDTDPQENVVLLVVGKTDANPVFQLAKVGAFDAGRELGEKYGRSVEVLYRSPRLEDPEQQAAIITQAIREGVDGIAITVTDPAIVGPAINQAVDAGISVVTFDSDAPASKRFSHHGIDDEEAGRLVVRRIVAILGDGDHVIATIAGNEAAVNLQHRVAGFMDEASKHPNVTVAGVFYHEETPEAAADTIIAMQEKHPDINGWALTGGWPFLNEYLLETWNKPEHVRVVSIDALPPMMPYLEQGMVEELYGQQMYQWGYRSVTLLLERIVEGKMDHPVHERFPLRHVEKATAAEFVEEWDDRMRRGMLATE